MSCFDAAVVALRGLSFIALLQAAGILLFLWLFGSLVQATAEAVRSLGKATVVMAVLATLAYHLAQPVRMTGTFSGVWDGSLHAMLLASDAGTCLAIRILGLVLIILGFRKQSRLAEGAGLIGTTLVAVSFAFMGHTATDDQRWLLAPLLVLHLLVVAFWFGALLPLYLASTHEAIGTNGVLIGQFSSLAVWLVPMIFLAGLAMSVALLPDPASLATPYGAVLIAKVAGFSMLMGLAGLNKLRLGPLIAAGQAGALRAFRRSVLSEWVLIAAILAATAAMTALFYPSP